MIDTKALREKVLDLAIRGKLVPQDPNDVPASVLLERIRAEKEQMVKDGKLKAKDIKNDTIIFKGDDNLHYEQFSDGTVKCVEDEVSFDLPEGWEWCNLGFLFNHNTGKALNSSNTGGIELTYITTSNVYWDRFELDELKSMGFNDNEIDKCTVTKGDLLVCEGGDIGRAAIWNLDEPIRIQNHLHRLRPYDKIVSRFYYYIFYLYKLNGKIKGNGIGLQGLSSNALHSIIVPIAPIKQQYMIVQKIEEIFDLIDFLDEQTMDLDDCIESIKSKILDLAIRGKLVSQNPDDEPASVLLERIRAEKEELIKAGKIKRDKKESVIFKGEDNSYYQDLPKNWSICTLGDISEIITGGTPSKSNKEYYNGSFPFFKPADLEQGVNTIIPSEYLSDEGKNVSRVIPAQSTLVCCIGTIGKSGFVRCECATNQQINAVIPYIEPKYVYYFCNSQFFINELQRNAIATTVAIINKSKTAETPFLLPPITEQKRIVEAIETSFAQLDEILNSIS